MQTPFDATLDEKMMNKIDSYMQEQKYRVAKPFYDSIVLIAPNTASNTASASDQKKWGINRQSMRMIINILSEDNAVDLYVMFVKALNNIETNEAAIAAAAKAKSTDAAMKATDATKTAAESQNSENNIVPMEQPPMEQIPAEQPPSV